MNSARNGHTLFEVMLVMAVLVIVGFLSVPYLAPMFSTNKVQTAQDLLKTRWAEMRYHAMNEGRPYRFGFQENSGKFRIAPDNTDNWGDGAARDASSDAGWVVESELPDEILFARSDKMAQPASSQGWIKALTFLPDGTAREDVVVAFGKSGSRSLTLRVQAAIGAVTTGESDAK